MFSSAARPSVHPHFVPLLLHLQAYHILKCTVKLHNNKNNNLLLPVERCT